MYLQHTRQRAFFRVASQHRTSCERGLKSSVRILLTRRIHFIPGPHKELLHALHAVRLRQEKSKGKEYYAVTGAHLL